MPINFPNSPADASTYTEGGTTWQYSLTNNSWTVTSFGNPGVSNGTDYDNTLVTLDNIGGSPTRNLTVAAVGLKYDPAVRNLTLTALSSHSTNLLTINDNSNNQLNAFNQRGILAKAGRVYYQATAPTVHADDTGQLWVDTDDNTIHTWNGTSWTQLGTGVTLNTAETISGVKTFSGGIALSSTAKLSGSGNSKSIELAPTNSGGTAATKLTVAETQATFASGVAVELSSVTATTKTVLATLADDQTISGLKTFTGNLKLTNAGGTDRIYSSSSTDGSAAGNVMVLQSNLSTNGRSITMYGNGASLATEGITIKPKNSSNQGELNVDGSTKITGNLVVTGSIISNSGLGAIGYAVGSLAGSGTPTNAGNITTAPRNLGPLSFTISTGATPTLNVVNSSSSPVYAYYERIQYQDPPVWGLQYVTFPGASTTNLGISTNAAGSATLVAGSTGSINLAATTPILLKIYLAGT